MDLHRSGLELWGGVECTRTRVGDAYCDQLELNGHACRPSDLDEFAALGLRTLRYPLLWERIGPDGPHAADWSWADGRMDRLRALGIRPIAGLMHHGSGPPQTNLLDPRLPDMLADYAGAVAKRYPWVDAYTPVNEPLTTARFCGLYGHWYPHKSDAASFSRALLTQCKAIILSMRAIRAVNSAALLVQTDDLGKTLSTPRMAYQARFENERRWLAWDLLCGYVDSTHGMWKYLRDWCGVSAEELAWFRDNACPPDIIGINHYLTSSRFLDHRLHLYPAHQHGGNGRDRYADVELVRAAPARRVRVSVLLREAWRRYKRPLAITECHLGCTREEQMRWLWEVWHEAQLARRAGVDVRAVTTWSLLGAFDWANLLTCRTGQYESGAFDVRAARPRATGVARLVRALAAGEDVREPVLDDAGWWQRSDRTSKRKAGSAVRSTISLPTRPSRREQPILITGATGTLGSAFSRICTERELAHMTLQRNSLDLTQPERVASVLREIRPWAVINAAGFVRVDDAECEEEVCRAVNAQGPAALADACAQAGIRLMCFSSDLVFGGTQVEPYCESCAVGPLNAYGRSKVEMERRVLANCNDALVIRPGPFFGPWDDYNFMVAALRSLRAGKPFVAADDVEVSPVYVPDLVHIALDLLVDHETGIWHLANQGRVTWVEWARQTAKAAGLSAMVVGRPLAELAFRARRPANSTLVSQRASLMPTFESAMARFMDARRDEFRNLAAPTQAASA